MAGTSKIEYSDSSIYPGGHWKPDIARNQSGSETLTISLSNHATVTVGISIPTVTVAHGAAKKRYPVILELVPDSLAVRPYTYFSEGSYISAAAAVHSYEEAVELVRYFKEKRQDVNGRIGLIGRGEAASITLRAAVYGNADAVVLSDGGIDDADEQIVHKLVEMEMPVLLWSGAFAKNRIKSVQTYLAYQNTYAGKPLMAQMDRFQKVTPACQLCIGKADPAEAVDLGMWKMWMDNWVKKTNADLRETKKPLHLYQGGSGGWLNASQCPLVRNGKKYWLYSDLFFRAVENRDEKEIQIGQEFSFVTVPFNFVAGVAGPLCATITLKTSGKLTGGITVSLYDVDQNGESETLMAYGSLDQPLELEPAQTWYDERGYVTWPAYRETVYDSEYKTFYVFLGFVHWDLDSGHALRFKVKTEDPLPADCVLITGGERGSVFSYPMAPGSCFTHPLENTSPSMWSYRNQCMFSNDEYTVSSDWGNGTALTVVAPYTIHDSMIFRDDGKKIIGREYVPNGNGPFPMVLFAHGIHSVRGVFREYQDYLARRGIASLAVDFCGGSTLSDSDGDTRDMSLSETQTDLDTAVAYIKTLDYVEQNNLFLIGHSQGGLVSAIYGPKHEDDFRGMILLAPGLSLCDTAKSLFETDSEIPEEVTLMMPLGKKWFLELRHIDPYEIASGYHKDVMITHGDADVSVPVEVSRRLAQCYDSVVYYEVPNAPHEYVGTDRECLKQRIYDFICTHM